MFKPNNWHNSQYRPTSFIEYMRGKEAGVLNYTHCVECSLPFSPLNTTTEAGWIETQISGLCEKCFDELFIERN